MSGDDSNALVALCASVLSDGEVTAEEAYQLAEWLNEHIDAAENWPGSKLIEPLQKMWADGSASARELHRLARILISIQREWAKERVAQPPAELLPEVVYRDVVEPRLPFLKLQMKIPSRSDAGLFYNVDLTGPTCSCPDWRGKRSRLPVGHLTRCCKHVFDSFAQLPAGLNLAEWLEAFLELAWPASPKAEWQLITIKSTPVLYSTAADTGWSNCFAKDGSTYERYGYNVVEHRWAYGSQPQSAWAIAEAIVSLGDKGLSYARSTSRSTNPSISGPKQTRSIAAVAWIALVVIGIFVAATVPFIFYRLSTPQSTKPPKIPKTSPLVSAAMPTDIQPPPAILRTPASAQSSTSPWVATTLRVVRAKAGTREIVIPKGAPLRVIGRSGSNVMVSYEGLSATVPASSTDIDR